jgi:UDP-2,4-diacetamido-2,4,6-trideoxy-beta-L-altropyranose hydrolase
MKKVYFRPSVGKTIGMGHFSRSLALAEYLSDESECYFFIPSDLPGLETSLKGIVSQVYHLPDISLQKQAQFVVSQAAPESIIVLDGYDLDTQYQRILKTAGHSLVCIDDIHNCHFFADVIINQQENLDHNIYSAEPYTKILSGLKYVLLRRPFEVRAREIKKRISDVKSVLINMGGADLGNITARAIEACLESGIFEKINIVTGSLYPFTDQLNSLAEREKKISVYKGLSPDQFCTLMINTDIAVLPASTVCLEAIAAGMGIVAGITADNQKGNLESLTEKGVIVNAGNLNNITVSALADLLKRTVREGTFTGQIEKQALIMDGQARRRYIDLFKQL